MDEKGCWRDDIFVERLWCSLKYEKDDRRGGVMLLHAAAFRDNLTCLPFTYPSRFSGTERRGLFPSTANVRNRMKLSGLGSVPNVQ